jgi:hypothetical protein
MSVASRPGYHAYICTRSPPIVHRDILRFISPDGSICVKFADFGLANTQTAPEIYAKRYTVGVDIWSLVMVFAERAGGLPDYYKKSTTAWNKAVCTSGIS